MNSNRVGRAALALAVVLLAAAALVGCTRDRTPADQSSSWTQTPGVNASGTAVGTAGTPVAGLPSATAVITGPAQSTTAPQVIPNTPVPAPSETWGYVVQNGDTLTAIAERFNTDVNVLVSINALQDSGAIRAGQVIKIPGQRPANFTQEPGSGQSGSAAGTYTVQRGDTLGQIARTFNTTVAELQRVNGLSNPNLIYPGQVLNVPGASGTGSSQSGGQRSYTVRRGDTLSQIAVRYGVTVAQIVQANGIQDPSKIVEGQTLVIP